MGDDPVAFVISMNLRRRHLDESQRALAAGKENTPRGANQHVPIGTLWTMVSPERPATGPHVNVALAATTPCDGLARWCERIRTQHCAASLNPAAPGRSHDVTKAPMHRRASEDQSHGIGPERGRRGDRRHPEHDL